MKYDSPTVPSSGSPWISRGKILALAPAAILSAWAAAALYFDVRVPWLQIPLALLYIAIAAVGMRWWFNTRFLKGFALWLGSLVAVMIWWFSLTPSNDRNWQPDVARVPSVEIDGNNVTIRDVRNFEYRSETDYTPRWDTWNLDLAQLRGVDIFVSHWGAPLIAHLLVSFQFGPDRYIAMSIEARKVVGQEYSALRGFFRQFELIHLVADERDVVRLRTNFRMDETVHLYKTMTKPEDARRLFLQYLTWMQEQRTHPRWYNAFDHNCSTGVSSYMAKSGIGGFPWWDPRLLANGLGEQMLYEHGDLVTGGLTFEELSKRSVINDAAKAADADPNFSLAIRKGRPGF